MRRVCQVNVVRQQEEGGGGEPVVDYKKGWLGTRGCLGCVGMRATWKLHPLSYLHPFIFHLDHIPSSSYSIRTHHPYLTCLERGSRVCDPWGWGAHSRNEVAEQSLLCDLIGKGYCGVSNKNIPKFTSMRLVQKIMDFQHNTTLLTPTRVGACQCLDDQFFAKPDCFLKLWIQRKHFCIRIFLRNYSN